MTDPHAPKSAVLLANPQAHSGKGAQLQQAVVVKLTHEAAHQDVALRIERTHNGAELREAAASAASQGERVIVMGGDGSVHQAVNGVAGTGAGLGIIAAGTGNDFARAMGLPVISPKMRASKATPLIASAVRACLQNPTDVDALAITSSGSGDNPSGSGGSADSPVLWSHSIATCGFAVDADNRASRLAWPKGPSKYTIASALEALKLKKVRYAITVDGNRQEMDAVLVALANTDSFGGGYFIAPEADSTDGLIDLVVIGPTTSMRFLRLMPATRKGRHISHPQVSTMRGKRIEIERLDDEADNGSNGDASENAGPQVRADGEPIGDFPIDVKIVPNALRIAGAVPCTLIS